MTFRNPNILKSFWGSRRLKKSDDIVSLPSYLRLRAAIESVANKHSEDHELLSLRSRFDVIDNRSSKTSVAECVDACFSICEEWITVLDSKYVSAREVINFVSEIMRKIHFHGKYLEASQALNEQLGSDEMVTVDWLQSARELIIDNALSLSEESSDMRRYLQKLQARINHIYASMEEQHESARVIHESRMQAAGLLQRSASNMQSMLDSENDLITIKQSLSEQLAVIDERLHGERLLAEQQNKDIQGTIEKLRSRVVELEKESTELRQNLVEKHEQLMRDPLTGLYNRIAYVNAMEKASRQWHQQRVPVTLMIWDIDKFKAVNDRYGHAIGDRVLKTVAKKLQQHCRQSDLVARIGGEEFVVVLQHADLDKARELAENIRQRIQQVKFTFENTPVSVTASCGLATFQEQDTPETVFKRADKALYNAKNRGRNQVQELTIAA